MAVPALNALEAVALPPSYLFPFRLVASQHPEIWGHGAAGVTDDRNAMIGLPKAFQIFYYQFTWLSEETSPSSILEYEGNTQGQIKY